MTSIANKMATTTAGGNDGKKPPNKKNNGITAPYSKPNLRLDQKHEMETKTSQQKKIQTNPFPNNTNNNNNNNNNNTNTNMLPSTTTTTTPNILQQLKDSISKYEATATANGQNVATQSNHQILTQLFSNILQSHTMTGTSNHDDVTTNHTSKNNDNHNNNNNNNNNNVNPVLMSQLNQALSTMAQTSANDVSDSHPNPLVNRQLPLQLPQQLQQNVPLRHNNNQDNNNQNNNNQDNGALNQILQLLQGVGQQPPPTAVNRPLLHVPSMSAVQFGINFANQQNVDSM